MLFSSFLQQGFDHSVQLIKLLRLLAQEPCLLLRLRVALVSIESNCDRRGHQESENESAGDIEHHLPPLGFRTDHIVEQPNQNGDQAIGNTKDDRERRHCRSTYQRFDADQFLN